MSRIPNIENTDYTKDISKATASFPAGTPRPVPRIPLTISDYTKDNSKATEENKLNDQCRSMLKLMRWPSGSLPGIIDYYLGHWTPTDALAQRQLTRHHRLPFGSLDPYLELTNTNTGTGSDCVTRSATGAACHTRLRTTQT